MTPGFGEWVESVSAIAAFAAAFVGWMAARAARDAARAGNSQAIAAQAQVRLAQKSADNALITARESIRARLDDRGPVLVSVLNEPTEEPFLLARSDTLDPFGEQSLRRRRSFARISRSDAGDYVIAIFGRGVVKNEGRLSAVVVGGSSSVTFDAGLGDRRPFRRPMENGEGDGQFAPLSGVVIEPGESLPFDWVVAKPGGDWVLEPGTTGSGDAIEIVAETIGYPVVSDRIQHRVVLDPVTQDPETRDWKISAYWLSGAKLSGAQVRREYRGFEFLNE
ncbi:hypothetical protein WIS52_25700 [Pseudonocardia nematodicida]|uniref:Uncharacterized protein n=1 Tax=Pseudonocardia nematodicida TaxID=1206997 RepID=A0ABV1KHR4_9PSEU